jgi:SAM-dependent methyltransferase
MTGGPSSELEALIADQVAYYRARAREYDITAPWDGEARARLCGALDAFAPRGDVLELACGTGQWTVELAARADHVTALDSAPEMLSLAAARVGDAPVRFLCADLFRWRPDRAYDAVFFSAWLSHVPPQRFASFWATVGDCLRPGGRVFLIDELPAVSAREEALPRAVAPAVARPLLDGTRHRAVKVFYRPEELCARLAQLGWAFEAAAVSDELFYAHGARARAG